MKTKFIFSVFILLCLTNVSNAYDIKIGTGSRKAVFFPTSKALCQLLEDFKEVDSCSVISTSGAEYNLKNLDKEFNFAISQLPLQFQYYQKNQDIRSVATLHIEHLTILTKKDSGIEHFSDLKGRNVHIGNPGSGSRIYFENIIKAFAWTLDDFSKINEENSSEIPDLICNDKVDAVVYLVGHPNQIYKQALTCDTHIVHLTRAEQDKIRENLPIFVHSVIHHNTYLNQNKVDTVGIQTVLSTTTNTPDELVKSVINSLVTNRKELLKLNHVYREINPLNIITFKHKAPLHDGVIDFLKRK